MHVEFQTGDGFIEQPFPRVAHHAQIVQEFLHLVGQLIGFHRADAVEHGFIPRQIGVLVHQFRQVIVVQPVQFQREKHQRRGKIGDLFLHVRHEFRTATVGGLLVIAQPGIGHDPPRDLVDLFLTQDAIQQPLGVQTGQIVLKIMGKAGASLFQPVQIAFQLGGVLACVQIIQIPLGQVAQMLVTTGCVGVLDRKGKLEHRETSILCWFIGMCRQGQGQA